MSNEKTPPTAKDVVGKMSAEQRAEFQQALDERTDEPAKETEQKPQEEPKLGLMSDAEFREHCIKKYGFSG